MNKMLLVAVIIMLFSATCFAEGGIARTRVMNWLDLLIKWIKSWIFPQSSAALPCYNNRIEIGYEGSNCMPNPWYNPESPTREN